MTLAQQQAADIAAIIETLGNPTGTWKNVTFKCLPSGFKKSKSTDVGGFAIEADLVLKVLKTEFPAGVYPNDTGRETLVYKTRTYRVGAVSNNETDVFLKLFCISATK